MTPEAPSRNPQTPSGEDLLKVHGWIFDPGHLERYVLAIEAEAAQRVVTRVHNMLRQQGYTSLVALVPSLAAHNEGENLTRWQDVARTLEKEGFNGDDRRSSSVRVIEVGRAIAVIRAALGDSAGEEEGQP